MDLLPKLRLMTKKTQMSVKIMVVITMIIVARCFV
jgi:hypothetical protein